MDSILSTIKKLLGIDTSYTQFDADLIVHINSAFMVLNQLGVGPKNGFFITGATETWANYSTDLMKIQSVKTYVFLKVRVWFDPPTTGIVSDAINRQINELEWRLNVAVDPGEEGDS